MEQIPQAGIRRLPVWKKKQGKTKEKRWLDGIKDMDSFNVMICEATRTAQDRALETDAERAAIACLSSIAKAICLSLINNSAFYYSCCIYFHVVDCLILAEFVCKQIQHVC